MSTQRSKKQKQKVKRLSLHVKNGGFLLVDKNISI
jgi:hypothetical protein